MKRLKKKWISWCSKALATGVSVLGFVSCSSAPCVYGPPPPRNGQQTNSIGKSRIQTPAVKPQPQSPAVKSVNGDIQSPEAKTQP